jgi:hypothetical protein
MAIAIKSIPVLTGKAAKDFHKSVKDNAKKVEKIDFSKQLELTAKILEKSKI